MIGLWHYKESLKLDFVQENKCSYLRKGFSGSGPGKFSEDWGKLSEGSGKIWSRLWSPVASGYMGYYKGKMASIGEIWFETPHEIEILESILCYRLFMEEMTQRRFRWNSQSIQKFNIEGIWNQYKTQMLMKFEINMKTQILMEFGINRKIKIK